MLIPSKLQPKVFISHKREDELIAIKIKYVLDGYGIDSFLDVLDLRENMDSVELIHHLKTQMDNCSDMLAIVSSVTHESWWVPFEIGMAAHINLPMVSFLKERFVNLPGYLKIWQTLPSFDALRDYAKMVKRRFNTEYVQQEGRIVADKDVELRLMTYSQLRSEKSTSVFYHDLNKALATYSRNF